MLRILKLLIKRINPFMQTFMKKKMTMFRFKICWKILCFTDYQFYYIYYSCQISFPFEFYHWFWLLIFLVWILFFNDYVILPSSFNGGTIKEQSESEQYSKSYSELHIPNSSYLKSFKKAVGSNSLNKSKAENSRSLVVD